MIVSKFNDACMRIFFVGLPGVGKTSVAKLIASHNSFEILNIGDLMKQIQYASSPSLDRKKEIFAKRANVTKYISENTNNRLLITGHGIVYFDKDDYIVGSTPEDIEGMKLSSLIIMEASPEIIYKRRLDDMHIRSDRIIENEKVIKENQQNQRRYYIDTCKKTKIPTFIFNNSQNIENSVNILMKIQAFVKNGALSDCIGIEI